MKFHVSQLRLPHLWPASVFSCEKGTLCQEFTMYWKQESMENEVAIISAVSKGQGFIYRTGAIQVEEKGPFSSVISVKGVEAWIRWPPVMMQWQETNMSIYKDQSFLGGL